MRTLTAAATAAAVCLLLLSPPAAAEPRAPAARAPYRSRHRLAQVLLTAGFGGLYIASSTVFKPEISPDECRWCAPPGFDARVRRALLWNDPHLARLLSDAAGYAAAPMLAFGFTVLPALHPDLSLGELIDTTLPIFESVVLSQSLSQIAKASTGRQRPYARFGGLPAVGTQDDNMSFFSGHASLAFALVTSAGVRAHQLHARAEPIIWTAGLPIATATAYLRVAGDKHYLSDVVVGSLVGAAAGVVVPWWYQRDLVLVPTGNGAAVAGRF